MPADTPLTIPLVPPMVATAVLPLPQVPKLVRSLKSRVDPAHKAPEPKIPDGDVNTVTVVVVVQPEPRE